MSGVVASQTCRIVTVCSVFYWNKQRKFEVSKTDPCWADSTDDTKSQQCGKLSHVMTSKFGEAILRTNCQLCIYMMCVQWSSTYSWLSIRFLDNHVKWRYIRYQEMTSYYKERTNEECKQQVRQTCYVVVSIVLLISYCFGIFFVNCRLVEARQRSLGQYNVTIWIKGAVVNWKKYDFVASSLVLINEHIQSE